jgi:hypothetical protein
MVEQGCTGRLPRNRVEAAHSGFFQIDVIGGQGGGKVEKKQIPKSE